MKTRDPMADSEAAISDAVFFRSADRLRLEGYVTALTQKGMSLSLVSTHESILDYYGKILLARLRQAAPDAQLEVYFPANSEALLTRFNEALGRLSVQDAMDDADAPAPPRIWIVHDAGALADHEIQLLARLVQHFPGANIRVLLFIKAASQKQKLLDSFGRRILCWDIEPPTAAQAQSMLEQASVLGKEGVVRALLKRLPLPAAAAPAAPAISATPQAEPPPAAAVAAPEPPTPAPARRSNRLRWVLVVLALLGASALAVAMFNRPSLGLALEGVIADINAVFAVKHGPASRASGAASASSAPLPAAPTASDPITAPVPVAAPASNAAAAQVVAVPAPATMAASGIVPAAASAGAGAGAAAIAPAAQAAVEAPKSAKPASPANDTQDRVELPPEALAGQAWVQPMPFGTYLVQHAYLSTYQDAAQWLQRHPTLKLARVVAAYRPEDAKVAHFVVVSGPFKNLADANKYSQGGDVPKGPWVRSARSLREQFTPELAAANANKR